ncbi:MAG: DegT/DnrJ/EryC1/StrS family aminotransferase [Vicinamibacterales bacterium]
MSTLALLGGTPVRDRRFPAHNPIGREERDAAIAVIEDGELSRFLGSWHPDFFGGARVQAFEAEWAAFAGAGFAVSVNSNTSGLLAAVAAAGAGPGDEVILPPYTMSATAAAVVANNAVPVFADINATSYCLDAAAIEARLTPRTRAIIVVHLFGHPADMDPILELAAQHGLTVIEDAAQAPGALYKGRPVGTLGHMTVFSLNYHKHIHTGEGGVVTTNDERLATRLRLVRNHGEAVVEEMGVTEIAHTFGFNLRLTELQAAIGSAQLRKLPALLAARVRNATFLSERIGALPGIHAPVVAEGCTHAYYVQPFWFDEEVVGVPRDRFVEAVSAELPTAENQDWPLVYAGYMKPLYLQPMYQRRIAYGASGCPFACPLYRGEVSYAPGICPVTERVERHIIGTEFLRPPADLDDMRDVAEAFAKVYEHRHELVSSAV